MTGKLRGRSSSQTPEPVSTPMARASTNSISLLPVPRGGARPCCCGGGGPGGGGGRGGEGGEEQQRGALHQREHADVKEQRAGNVDLAHPGQVQPGGVAGQERI